MQKKVKKLALHRETLTQLNRETLSAAAGASNAVLCYQNGGILISDAPGGCNIYTPFC